MPSSSPTALHPPAAKYPPPTLRVALARSSSSSSHRLGFITAWP